MALINLRNALMAGKRLPYDAEVEYLESTGTQHIDLGFSLTPSSDLYATVMLRGTVPNAVIFGQSNQFAWGANNPAYAIANSSAGKIFFTYGPTNNLYTSDIGVGTLTDISYVGTTYTINGTTTTIPRVSSWSAVQGNAHVFCRGYANGSISPISKTRVYSIKFVDNGATTHHFIPVRKGTVGYLYDRVSGKLFGNAGSGDFVLGQDVVPVEYIESHGTEYIDTPWTPDLTTDLRVSGRAGFATTDKGMLLSAYNSGSPNNVNISFELYSDFYFRVYAYADVFSRFKCADSVKQMFDYSIVYTALNGLLSCTANGIERSGTVLTQSRVVNTMPARLGADYRAANRFGLFGPVKVYNPGLIFDFNPVRVGTDATSWEGAMMDVLTRRIYRNAGTGAFGYGNDLKYPIPAA